MCVETPRVTPTLVPPFTSPHGVLPAIQSSRRRRHASPLITPEVEYIEGVYTAWKFPRAYHGDGERTFKGLYVVFHGCRHGPTDW